MLSYMNLTLSFRMMGSITLLEKILPVKNQQVSEVLSVAKCCGEHLHTLIGNLLEFSKLKKKKVELNKGQVDLKSNVRKIVKMNYFKAKEKSNRLNLYVSRNFPKKVIADE
jgi:signal transduction histidine kinase